MSLSCGRYDRSRTFDGRLKSRRLGRRYVVPVSTS